MNSKLGALAVSSIGSFACAMYWTACFGAIGIGCTTGALCLYIAVDSIVIGEESDIESLFGYFLATALVGMIFAMCYSVVTLCQILIAHRNTNEFISGVLAVLASAIAAFCWYVILRWTRTRSG